MIEDCSVQNCWCWSSNVRAFYRKLGAPQRERHTCVVVLWMFMYILLGCCVVDVFFYVCILFCMDWGAGSLPVEPEGSRGAGGEPEGGAGGDAEGGDAAGSGGMRRLYQVIKF